MHPLRLRRNNSDCSLPLSYTCRHFIKNVGIISLNFDNDFMHLWTCVNSYSSIEHFYTSIGHPYILLDISIFRNCIHNNVLLVNIPILLLNFSILQMDIPIFYWKFLYFEIALIKCPSCEHSYTSIEHFYTSIGHPYILLDITLFRNCIHKHVLIVNIPTLPLNIPMLVSFISILTFDISIYIYLYIYKRI